MIPSLYAPQSLNRYGYVVNNPIRYNDPSGHMCSDPEDPTPTCDGSKLPTNNDPSRMIEYQMPTAPQPPIGTLLPIVEVLANNDQSIIDAWKALYQSVSGYQYANYIVDNNIMMYWGSDPQASHPYCVTDQGGDVLCIIEFANTLQRDVEADQGAEQIKFSELVLSMAHEAYHIAYGRPDSMSSDLTADSRAEEFAAFSVETDVHKELEAGGWIFKNLPFSFDGYQMMVPASLRQWFIDYQPSYLSLPSYPPY